jgi:hypothetical protein
MKLPGIADSVSFSSRVAITLGVGAAVAVAWKIGFGSLLPRSLGLGLFAALAIVAYRHAVHGFAMRRIAVGLLLGCAMIGAFILGRAAVESLMAPRMWDFLAFYVDGSVGARGLNFYQSASYAEVYSEMQIPIAVTDDFVREIVDVGFKYPPMTMFLFSWMGKFPFGQAHVLWLGFVCATFLFAIWAVARGLLEDGPLAIRLLVTLALVGLLPASVSNLYFEQTNALVLGVGVLALSAASERKAGLVSAMAIAIKPIMALTLAYLFLRSRWRSIAISALALAGMLTAAALAFGPITVLDYVRANPVGNVPPWIFTEWVNQSLLATLLRGAESAVAVDEALMYPPFLLTGGAVGLTSLWLAWRLARRGDPLAFGLLVATSLLLYPGVLKPYGMLMLIPLVILFRRIWHLHSGVLLAATFIAVVYFVDTYMSFAAHALVWSATSLWAVCGDELEAWLGLGQRESRTPGQRDSR